MHVSELAASNNKSTNCNMVTFYTSKVKEISVISEPDPATDVPPIPTFDFQTVSWDAACCALCGFHIIFVVDIIQL